MILGFRPQGSFKVQRIFRVDLLTILNKGRGIHGSRYISMAQLIETVKIVKEAKIKPVVTETLPLKEAEQVHQLLQTSRITGKGD